MIENPRKSNPSEPEKDKVQQLFLTPIPREQRTLREIAMDHLRNAILKLELKPGDRLIERNLCAQLGVSRTIIREAIRGLEGEGLLSKDIRGPIVRQPTRQELEQIYELRAILESMAAAHCAARASDSQIATLSKCLEEIDRCYSEKNTLEIIRYTDDFYEKMFLFAECTVAWELVQKLKGRISVYRSITISSTNRKNSGMTEMHAILNAIKKRDAKKASIASSHHIETASGIALKEINGKL